MIQKLQDNVSVLKGIGEETEKTLNELGIHTVADLLGYFPYRYDDYELRNLEEVKHDERVTVEGKVHSEPVLTYYGKKRSRLTFRLLVGRFLITAICFNRPYLKRSLVLGDTVSVTGKWDKNRQSIMVQEFKKGTHEQDGSIEPVYSVKENVTVKMMRRFVKQALSLYVDKAEDPLPKQLVSTYKLMSYQEALKTIHLPETRESLKQARRRFVYEEFLIFQLKMQAIRKKEREKTSGIQHLFSKEAVFEFVHSLPFPLTKAQSRVLDEIMSDMASRTG